MIDGFRSGHSPRHGGQTCFPPVNRARVHCPTARFVSLAPINQTNLRKHARRRASSITLHVLLVELNIPRRKNPRCGKLE
jgi:hypothetical protein